MHDSYYKGYWMVTNRCNLRCSYCVLEDAPHQLQAELDLDAKKELVSHLYDKLGFRRLTLSGGEVTIIGKRPPKDFIELIKHIRKFRSSEPGKNLEIELYTNGRFINEQTVQEMEGVVDLVAVTIDSADEGILREIGRKNKKGHDQYFKHINEVCSLLSNANITVKLHSVVSQKNQSALPNEVSFILDSIENSGGIVESWKFYQYMSYDTPERDLQHKIPTHQYDHFRELVKVALNGRNIRLHFKDNEEMNASLFNILSYGNAQYMRPGDSWSTSQRTNDLRTYQSMAELFEKHDIDETRFRKFHEVTL